MSENKVPITRIGKFFGEEDFSLDVSIGSEWLEGDMNFTLVLYRIDRTKTKITYCLFFIYSVNYLKIAKDLFIYIKI